MEQKRKIQSKLDAMKDSFEPSDTLEKLARERAERERAEIEASEDFRRKWKEENHAAEIKMQTRMLREQMDEHDRQRKQRKEQDRLDLIRERDLFKQFKSERDNVRSKRRAIMEAYNTDLKRQMASDMRSRHSKAIPSSLQWVIDPVLESKQGSLQARLSMARRGYPAKLSHQTMLALQASGIDLGDISPAPSGFGSDLQGFKSSPSKSRMERLDKQSARFKKTQL